MASLDDSFTENTFGDLSYTFLEPVPNYLTCIICYGLLKDAVATDCCEKMFCNEHSSRTEQICPACRHVPLSVSRNRGIDSIVKDLKVFCLNHKESCPWSGHLCFEPNHRAATCDYQSIPCAKQCGVQVARRLMANHLANECLLREIECEFCDYKGTTAEVAFHLETCPEYHVACPRGCELHVPRKELSGHSSTCPEAPVPCPFANAGCDTVPVKRKELAGHLETSVGAHLLLLASDNQRLSEEVVELRKERNEHLEQERAKVAKLEKVKTELQHVQTELHQVKMELRQTKDRVDRLIENERRNEVEDGQGEDDTDNHSVGWETDSQSDSDNVGAVYSYLDYPYPTTTWVEDLYSTMPLADLSLPVVLRYQNVSADMSEGSTWTSPEFYDDAGYCMRLHVTPNGIKQALGRFVSVQMQIREGENDHRLHWPYNDDLHVEILTPHANHSHCRKMMEFDSFPDQCVERPDYATWDGWNAPNEPWGILRFLNHNQLDDYLSDDTLYFHVKHMWQNDL